MDNQRLVKKRRIGKISLLEMKTYPQRVPLPCPLKLLLKLILTKIDLSVFINVMVNAINRSTTSKKRS